MELLVCIQGIYGCYRIFSFRNGRLLVDVSSCKHLTPLWNLQHASEMCIMFFPEYDFVANIWVVYICMKSKCCFIGGFTITIVMMLKDFCNWNWSCFSFPELQRKFKLYFSMVTHANVALCEYMNSFARIKVHSEGFQINEKGT